MAQIVRLRYILQVVDSFSPVYFAGIGFIRLSHKRTIDRYGNNKTRTQ